MAPEPATNSCVVKAGGVLVMDRDAATLPIFIACMAFTLIMALTYVWV